MNNADFGYEAALEVKAPYYEVKAALERGKLKSVLLYLEHQTPH